MKNKIPLVLAATIMLFCTGCHRQPFNQMEGSAFGTVYHITYPGKPSPTLHRQIDSVLDIVNATFSVFDTNSLISRINRGDSLPLNKDMLTVLNTSLKISEQTAGAFDCTCQPLVELYGFGRQKRQQDIPQRVLDSVKAFVGYRLLSIQGSRLVKKDPRVQLNFNAIAKGYAVDKVASFLKAQGYQDFIVEIGGEIVTAGTKNGKPWKVGIQVPTETADQAAESFQNFTLSDKAVATSGNYRNYFEKDGIRYTHILDPASGKSEQTNLLSVTIIAPDCITADAYATGCMVLGVDKTVRLLRQHPELEAYLIYGERQRFKVMHIE